MRLPSWSVKFILEELSIRIAIVGVKFCLKVKLKMLLATTRKIEVRAKIRKSDKSHLFLTVKGGEVALYSKKTRKVKLIISKNRLNQLV